MEEVKLCFDSHWSILASLEYDSVSSDVIMSCKDGKVSAHKIILFSAIPQLKELLCFGCRLSHDEMHIILPEMLQDDAREALRELYSNRNPGYLMNLLDLRDTKSLKRNINEVISQKDSHNNSNTKHRSGEETEVNVKGELDIKQECDDLNVASEFQHFAQIVANNRNPFVVDYGQDIVQVENFRNMSEEEFNSNFQVGLKFASVLDAKTFLEIYMERRDVKFVIAKNDKKSILYCCHCGRTSKPKGLGIRRTSSKSTLCPAEIRMTKSIRGYLKITRIEESHNHDSKHGLPKEIKGGYYNWAKVDHLIRDAVISDKSVEEVNEMLFAEGVHPLPSMLALTKKVKGFKRQLGLEAPYIGPPKNDYRWNNISEGLVREGVIHRKGNHEIREILEAAGVAPLPTLLDVKRKSRYYRKMYDIQASTVINPSIKDQQHAYKSGTHFKDESEWEFGFNGDANPSQYIHSKIYPTDSNFNPSQPAIEGDSMHFSNQHSC